MLKMVGLCRHGNLPQGLKLHIMAHMTHRQAWVPQLYLQQMGGR
jgi:hypothetical protein